MVAVLGEVHKTDNADAAELVAGRLRIHQHLIDSIARIALTGRDDGCVVMHMTADDHIDIFVLADELLPHILAAVEL